ncbi:LytR C-terminal domain-containing protein [Nostocoides sp. HKS02]|uniref:LytR C-terminal domain-containing protein n=1 Tax=Nostocoides sp. HKS02 TaxID=1813880 RepID=UPI001E4442D4|nr:LytR C-terminal domain-containing protein [Tetrasphaera sp. HKS02]
MNIVDLPVIQSTVHTLLYGAATSSPRSPKPTSSPTTTAPAPHAVVEAVNASGRTGVGHSVLAALARKGYTQGQASTYPTQLATSVIDYAPGEQASATALSSLLGGLPTRIRAGVAPGSLRLVIGTDFNPPAGAGLPTTRATAAPPAKAVSAVGGGRSGPPPSALTDLAGGGIPCVK